MTSERMTDERLNRLVEYRREHLSRLYRIEPSASDARFCETIDALKAERAEVERLRRENDILRGMAATKMPCHYCGAETMGMCPHGFPGCSLADDLICAEESVGKSLQARLIRLIEGLEDTLEHHNRAGRVKASAIQALIKEACGDD